MPYLSVPAINDIQQKKFWCWAAVSVNVYNSMLPLGAPHKTQCDVVTKVQGNCAGDETDTLPSGLAALGISDRLLTAPNLSTVTFEIGGGDKFTEPVCAVVLFPGNATHFVAVFAVDTDLQSVWVADPFVGGNPVEFSYHDFVNNYTFTVSNQVFGPGTVQRFARVAKPE